MQVSEKQGSFSHFMSYTHTHFLMMQLQLVFSDVLPCKHVSVNEG